MLGNPFLHCQVWIKQVHLLPYLMYLQLYTFQKPGIKNNYKKSYYGEELWHNYSRSYSMINRVSEEFVLCFWFDVEKKLVDLTVNVKLILAS